jgi:hypothetical protein
MVTPAARREAVAYLRVAFAVSERRACFVIGADRTSVRYRSLRLWGSFCGDNAAQSEDCRSACLFRDTGLLARRIWHSTLFNLHALFHLRQRAVMFCDPEVALSHRRKWCTACEF